MKCEQMLWYGGCFYYQGVGWCKITEKTRIHNSTPGTFTSFVYANDVDSITQVASEDYNGEIGLCS